MDEFLEDRLGYQDAELVTAVTKGHGRGELPARVAHLQKGLADATERCVASGVHALIVDSLEACEIEHERAIDESI